MSKALKALAATTLMAGVIAGNVPIKSPDAEQTRGKDRKVEISTTLDRDRSTPATPRPAH